MSVYQPYPAAYQHEVPGSLYADVANHCENWSYYGAGDKLTGAHEATHGINAQLRNANGCWYETWQNHHKDGGHIFPVFKGDPNADAKINAFYCLNSNAAIVPEPACKKSDLIPFVPTSLHGSRWELYCVGQTEWDSSPLYIYDEFSAYTNQGLVAIDLYQRGEKLGLDQDTIYGAIEFIPYGIGVLMAADKANSLSAQLIEYAKVQLRRACNCYHAGKGIYRWQGQDELWQAITMGADAAPLRQFLASKLSFLLPGFIVPEEGLR